MSEATLPQHAIVVAATVRRADDPLTETAQLGLPDWPWLYGESVIRLRMVLNRIANKVLENWNIALYSARITDDDWLFIRNGGRP